MSKQLLMFPKWWHDPDIWRVSHLYSDISRPTEDMAIENVFIHASVIGGNYRTVLSELERDVDNCFTKYKQARSGYDTRHYANQTATRLKMPVFQVLTILEDIEYVKRNFERVQASNITILPNVLNMVA